MTKTPEVRAVLVEDEPLAREVIRGYVEEVDWLTVVGEAADGRTAIALIDELRPDLVFLDVQLPEVSGLEVLERIDAEPVVIFTTAHDEYAVTAFEFGALDYLLKPCGRDRFLAAVERARASLMTPTAAPPARERAREALGEGTLERIFVRERERILPVRMEDVVRFEAEGDYVRIHHGGVSHLAALSLRELEERLSPERFRRVHRSHMVNLDRIDALEYHDDRRLRVLMEDGSEVVASRSGTRELRDLLV